MVPPIPYAWTSTKRTVAGSPSRARLERSTAPASASAIRCTSTAGGPRSRRRRVFLGPGTAATLAVKSARAGSVRSWTLTSASDLESNAAVVAAHERAAQGEVEGDSDVPPPRPPGAAGHRPARGPDDAGDGIRLDRHRPRPRSREGRRDHGPQPHGLHDRRATSRRRPSPTAWPARRTATTARSTSSTSRRSCRRTVRRRLAVLEVGGQQGRRRPDQLRPAGHRRRPLPHRLPVPDLREPGDEPLLRRHLRPERDVHHGAAVVVTKTTSATSASTRPTTPTRSTTAGSTAPARPATTRRAAPRPTRASPTRAWPPTAPTRSTCAGAIRRATWTPRPRATRGRSTPSRRP